MDSYEHGAANALRALEQEEAQARAYRDDCRAIYNRACKDALEKPMEKDGTDWDRLESVAKRHLDDSEERLTDIRKLLLSYDKSVAPEKRDVTEKITRDEVSRLWLMIAVYERQATSSFIHSVANDILTCKTPEEVHAMTADKLENCKKNAVEMAVREGHLPAWFKKITQQSL